MPQPLAPIGGERPRKLARGRAPNRRIAAQFDLPLDGPCRASAQRNGLQVARDPAQIRFHAVTTPRVPRRPSASHSVPDRGPPPAVPHQAKRRKRPSFSSFFAVLAMAPPARIELATLALGKPGSIQLSYGGGRRRLSRPRAVLKLVRVFATIFQFLPLLRACHASEGPLSECSAPPRRSSSITRSALPGARGALERAAEMRRELVSRH